MAVQAHCEIQAQIKVPGVAIQIAEYRWHRGAELRERNEFHVIRRRVSHENISVRGAMDKGEIQTFGNLMLFPAKVDIRTLAAEDDVRERVTTAWLDPEWLNTVTGVQHSWGIEDLARCFDLRNARIDHALRWMGAEVLSPSFGSSILVESLSLQIAVEITRHFLIQNSPLRVRAREGKLSQEHVNRVIDYIESCPHNAVTLQELASLCGISTAHLRRAFKNSTGQTVHEYVCRSRLRQAKRLLAETDLPLKEISYRLGFTASSTFSAVFRKGLGETPSDYRYRTRH